MKKRILAAIITAVMVIAMIPLTAFAGGTTPTFDTAIGTITELNTLFTDGGSGYLTADIEATDYLTIKGDKTVDLNLKGYTIDLNKKNITLGYSSETGTLNLYDTVGTGTISNGEATDDNGGAVYVGRNSCFSMYGGTIEGCKADRNGGAVYVHFGSSFVMNKGTIRNCKAQYGGAVYIDGGSFHMFDGLISGNEANYGGAVVNVTASVSFHMHGGEISDNIAVYKGGGVYNLDNGYSKADCSFDGKCIVKDNYSYQGDDKKTDDKKIRDNVLVNGALSLLTIGNDRGKKVLEDGSEIWVTLSGRISGAITDSNEGKGGTASEVKYFRSDADAYYVTYDKDAGCMKLVSRITQQPTPENHYTIKINTEGLGYTDPEYQWYERSVTPLKDLKENVDFTRSCGSIIPSNNSVKSEYDTDAYIICFEFKFDVLRITFNSDNVNPIGAGYNGTLKDDGKNYELITDPDNNTAFLYSENENFTITNIMIHKGVQEFDDHDATLNGGANGKTYFCRLTYKDGSIDDSSDVTVVAHGDHKWSYSLSKKVADNDTIKATCDEKGECDYKGTDTSLTISAEDATEDGKAHGAALSGKTLAGVAEKDFPVIQYEKEISESKYDKATTEAPKEAGKYRAGITVGEGEAAVTAYVKYEIKEKKKVQVTFDANGGTGSMDNLTVKEDDIIKLPENSFKAPDGKKFKSWSIDGQTYNAGSEVKVTKDIIVKAEWGANVVTADFASFWVYLMIAGFALASIGYGALKLTKKSGR